MEALDRLRPTPIRGLVITTVTSANIGELPAIHELLASRGVDGWVVQLGHRTGRLAEAREGAVAPIRPDQVRAVADFIVSRAGDARLRPSAHNSLGYLSRDEPVLRASGRRARHSIWRGCRCGIATVGIEPDGGIKGCASQVGPPFVVGTVRRERLREIWEDRARWHWLSPRPEQFGGRCARCALAAVCQAGCTALAYGATGSLFDNPYCLRALDDAT
jgi:radical SAM protein with 4Fe4S-binding SPASM domain